MIEYIYTHANMYTIVFTKDRSLGLDAEFLHVFISKSKKIKFNHYIIRRFNK